MVWAGTMSQDKLGLNLYVLDAVTGHLVHQSSELTRGLPGCRGLFAAWQARLKARVPILPRPANNLQIDPN